MSLEFCVSDASNFLSLNMDLAFFDKGDFCMQLGLESLS